MYRLYSSGERVSSFCTMLRPSERGDGEHLRLAALEEPGAVGAREDADVDIEGADVLDAAAVGADALLEDLLPHRLLDDVPEGISDVGGWRSGRRNCSCSSWRTALFASERSEAAVATSSGMRSFRYSLMTAMASSFSFAGV
ncbi:hypothetical protein O0235_04475 [Tepidiforma flava]|uniref:Uncharacterized protein n=1 Tax=Tepidiforma flava TaxID=3004094 RepID=A0ABY7M8G1_9CHLR|nr:hypothetical protein [Tepidiforma flava]WBL36819.1 hypothetical protein O0235_04475 [Tepidiforma flava]